MEDELGLPGWTWIGVIVAVCVPAGGQAADAGGRQARDTSTTPVAAVVSRTMTGRVTNSVTGAGIPRSLVTLNSHAMLTDAQGRFSFGDVTETQAYVSVQKPGYSQNPEPGVGATQVRVQDLDAPLELKLYPDALVTGTVTGPDGLPLARIQVRLRRLMFDSTGPRWQVVADSQTDEHGQYRFTQAAGRYRVTTAFNRHSQETGEVVVPVAFPSLGTGNHGDYLELHPGDVQEINLRPNVGPGNVVAIKLSLEDGQRGVRLTATGSSGVTFRLPAEGRATNGEYRVELPVGTYTIRAWSGDRELALMGSTRVTVTARATTEVPMQLLPAAVFPVELVFQGRAGATPATARQVDMWLQNRANDGDGEDGDAQMIGRGDAPPEMRAMPGRYRLVAGRLESWTARSATCGATDLLREDLVVGPGAAGSTIRVVLSDSVGRLHGTVTAAGVPRAGWVYLIPVEPTLTPAFEVILQPDGTYRWSGAPGRYTAVVSDHQVREDFRDAKFREQFAAGGRKVEVTEDGDAAADLVMGAVAP